MLEIRKLLDTIEKQSIFEGASSISHPEDLIITDGVKSATRSVQSIINAAKSPKSISMKWDGYPALIFGRGSDGKFIVVDKHMWSKKDGSGKKIYSPKDFIQYDKNRQVDRSGLYDAISNIWTGLEQATKGTKGFYWGDLLFSQPLKDTNGLYKFKANPNGITYTVDVNSDLGNLIKNKIAGIAVHQYIPSDALDLQAAVPIQNDVVQNLNKKSNIAFLSSNLPISPKISLDKSLINDANSAIKKYGKDVEQLITTAPQARSSFASLFTSYINKKVISGDLQNLASDFLDYFEALPMTDSMRKKLSEHINNNKNGVIGLFAIWSAIYKLKMDLVSQLTSQVQQSPVKGYLDSGQPSQEGYISNGLKYIDRLGFSKQLLRARN